MAVLKIATLRPRSVVPCVSAHCPKSRCAALHLQSLTSLLFGNRSYSRARTCIVVHTMRPLRTLTSAATASATSPSGQRTFTTCCRTGSAAASRRCDGAPLTATCCTGNLRSTHLNPSLIADYRYYNIKSDPENPKAAALALFKQMRRPPILALPACRGQTAARRLFYFQSITMSRACLLSVVLLVVRRFFGQEGWPSSTMVKGVPSTEDEQAALIDVLQDWKSAHYQELVGACCPCM